MSNSKIDVRTVHRSLSKARLQTYEKQAELYSCSALDLYTWNAQISSSMLVPLHFCEVTLRNAVSETLCKLYDDQWPWSLGFERSLPKAGYYKPASDLKAARNKAKTTGQVIPELKFVFWQKMFTRRFDDRIWLPEINSTFPNLPQESTPAESREKIYQDLDIVRRLRNRIAHHEPIFQRNLARDYQTIHELVFFRCHETAHWMHTHQQVTQQLNLQPFVPVN